jgi:hypothetical protein
MNFNLFSCSISLGGLFGMASAASLTFVGGEALEIMNTNEDPDNRADISVFAGRAGYQGIGGISSNTAGNPLPASGLFGDGTVLDYRFFSSPVDKNVSLELFTYALSGEGRIGAVSATSAAQVAGNQAFLNVWETDDPGAGFGGGSQITTTSSANHVSNTMAGLGDGSGIIDITNMTSGTLYFLAGGYGGTERITMTMSGAGQTDIVTVGSDNWARPNRVHLHEWDFDNTDNLYDTITFNFYHADQDGSAARFGGIILDGIVIPEPSLLAFLGIGGIVFGMRTRRPKR